MNRGFVHIYTGEGKGKTTASVGLALRAKSRGLRVLFTQLMKPGRGGDELDLLERLSISVRRYTEVRSPYFHPGIDAEELRLTTLRVLAEIRGSAERFDLVVIDEFNNLVGAGVISEAEALQFIRAFPEGTELVLTGRGATPAMMEAADYVTDMKAVKHPHGEGQGAREGIEY